MTTIEELISEKEELERLVVKLAAENQQLKDEISEKKANDILFADLIEQWLKSRKMAVKINTYEAYRSQVYVHIVPYFRSKGTMLSEITPGVLEEYYLVKYNAGLSGLTIRKHHSNIKMALSYAVKNSLTDHNAALLAELPCTDRYCGNFISTDQFEIILNKVKNTDLYTPVFLAGTMGLRRSEVLGLRWSDINFETQTMCIQHTIVKCIKDHKITLVFSDVPKTRASRRTLPLPSGVLRYLKELRRRQCDNYTAHRDKYSREYLKYICVDDMGLIVKPDDLSVGFGRIMAEMNFHCRFHDLRHTCASLLVQHGVELKSVSVWLGHSSIAVTSDIYTHLTYREKLKVAETIDEYMKDVNVSR
mgnify:FL=1